MNFENELISGVLIKRYKRFFVDIKVKNQIITAHCPNTGSMMGLLTKGNKVWISKSNNPKRKLKYTIQIIEKNKRKIGINTHITNKIVREGLENKIINGFNDFVKIEPEKKYGNNTRFDFLIIKKTSKIFLEVKNVTLCRKNNLAEFPDSVTDRGAKHIRGLLKAIKEGYKGYILFVVQREDCKYFSIASDIDPIYSKLLTDGVKKKLKIICYDCKFSTKGIKLNKELKIQI